MPSVTNRLTIITEIISPYRIPLFNALNRHPNVDLHLIFLAETDPELRQWQVYKNEIDFSYEVLPSYRKRIRGHNALFNRGVARSSFGREAGCDSLWWVQLSGVLASAPVGS